MTQRNEPPLRGRRRASRTIALDQPDTRNALSDELLDRAARRVRDGRADAGRALRGAHVHAREGLLVRRQPRRLRGRRAADPQALRHRRSFPRLFRAIGELGKPTLCAANGHVLAGALGLALACDLIVAKEGARFGTPEINVGVFPFMIMALIYRNVGRKKTNELLLLGEQIAAEEAERIGIVNRVVPADEFDAAVARLGGEAGREVAGDDAARQGRDVPPAGHGVRRRARVPAPQLTHRVLDRGHPGGRQGVLREARPRVDRPVSVALVGAALPHVRPLGDRGARRRGARPRRSPSGSASSRAWSATPGEPRDGALARRPARRARLPARGRRPGRGRARRRRAARAARRPTARSRLTTLPARRRAATPRRASLWLDAHGDFNTPDDHAPAASSAACASPARAGAGTPASTGRARPGAGSCSAACATSTRPSARRSSAPA